MKTNLNQIGSPGAVAAIIGVVLLLNFPVLVKAADVLSSNIEPVAVTLQPGVTGVEIQQALDAFDAQFGLVPGLQVVLRQALAHFGRRGTHDGIEVGVVIRIALEDFAADTPEATCRALRKNPALGRADAAVDAFRRRRNGKPVG